MAEWIPVSERLPEEYEPVLVWMYEKYSPKDSGALIFSYIGLRRGKATWEDFEGFKDKCYSAEITHWMPLPPPPEQERER